MPQASKTTKKPSVLARLKKYLRDVWTELKRTTWPSRAEVLKSSGIVLVTLIFFLVLTFVVDNLSSPIIMWLAGLGR